VTLGTQIDKMYKPSLTIVSKSSDKKVNINLEFSDEEWTRFNNYSKYTDKLNATRFVSEEMGSTLKIKYDVRNGTKFSWQYPSDDNFAAFIHRLRPFVLNREDTYFPKISNLYRKKLNHSVMDELFKTLKEHFDGTNSQKFFRLKSNEIIVNSDNTLYNWLNAYEFHHEEDKRELLRSMNKIFPEEASRAIFVMLLIDKSKAIQVLNGIIRPIIGKVKTVKIDFGSQIIIKRA